MPHRDERPRGATTVTLDDLDLAVSPARSAVVSPPCMGECVDDRHPTLQGRVRVRWTDATGGPRDRWVPTLQGVAVREGDRVLLVTMAHEDEPVVTGVIDGFAARLGGEVVRGGSGLRVALPPDFDPRPVGLPFSVGIEGHEDGAPRVRRWSGGLPEGIHHGAPGLLLPLGRG